MNNLTLRFAEGEPKTKDKKIVSDGLLTHHASSGHTRITTYYSIFVINDENKILGGIILSFLWNGMRIDSLWVDESIRSQRWGTKLIEEAEKEARKRNCSVIYTDTFSWQAPDFYKKLGYKEYGKLKDFPVGNTLTYFQKRLL